jgi:Domain of unknown function (DUF4440)
VFLSAGQTSAVAFCGLLFLSFLASAHPIDPAPIGIDSKQWQEVQRFRQALATAASSKDVNAVRRMYTDDFTHTHTSGKVDGKDARVLMVLAGDPTVELAPTTEFFLSCFGQSTCIIRALSPIKRALDGKWFDVRWTQTLVRTSAGWQMAISHATGLMNTVRDQP